MALRFVRSDRGSQFTRPSLLRARGKIRLTIDSHDLARLGVDSTCDVRIAVDEEDAALKALVIVRCSGESPYFHRLVVKDGRGVVTFGDRAIVWTGPDKIEPKSVRLVPGENPYLEMEDWCGQGSDEGSDEGGDGGEGGDEDGPGQVSEGSPTQEWSSGLGGDAGDVAADGAGVGDAGDADVGSDRSQPSRSESQRDQKVSQGR